MRAQLDDKTSSSATQLAEFIAHCEESTGERFGTAAEFDRFAATRYSDFWQLFLEWAGPVREGEDEPVCVGDLCETATFFPQMRLSYAENLLATGREESETAVIVRRPTGARELITRGELRDRVR